MFHDGGWKRVNRGFDWQSKLQLAATMQVRLAEVWRVGGDFWLSAKRTAAARF
jgi:hypothetical protein